MNKLGTQIPIHVKVYISRRKMWHYEKNIQFTARLSEKSEINDWFRLIL